MDRRCPTKGFDEGGECDDAHTLESMLRLELLYRRTGALTPFLPVERECNGGGLGAGAADEIQRFANRSACGDHVVDDDHAPAHGAPTRLPPSPWSLPPFG